MRGPADAKDGGERQVCAVAAGLIPSLDGGADRASDDGEVQDLGDAPLVQDLVVEDLDLGLVEGLVAVNLLEARWVLGDESALA